MAASAKIDREDEIGSLVTSVELGDGVPQKKTPKVALPVGTVTLILADAEGSTRFWESDPDSVAPATNTHDRIVDEAVGRNGGVRPKDQGEGDSFFAAFSRPSDALAAAIEIQQGLRREGSPIRLRMAVHTGEVQLRNESNYIGVAINRTARIRATGHGGQLLLSQVTHDLVADRLPEGVAFEDLGVHRLKDLSRPERIFQVLHPDLAHEFPPLRSLDSLPNNLPVQRTSFIGRTRELAELQSLLDTTRTLTLSGSGGAGKSRLAVQLGAELLDRFEDGVWFVPLASVQEDAGVAQQTATALGLAETQVELLPKFIGAKTMLLILDNAEHVLEAAGTLSAQLLDSCPDLRILVTSRAPLAIEGETTYRVPSLTLPEADSRVPIGSLAEYEAVQLFVDRAVKARPNFKLEPQNAETVVRICRRLDGIPLALELAAARIRVLSAQQILEGLSDRFRLLTGSTRALMPRQQTLRASVDWSHDLLDETESKVFRRLAVFPAPFDLDAAESVAASEDLPGLLVLDVLTQLVDKSLVVASESGTTTRYSLLETIREYAMERLNDSEEKEDALERHRDHHLRWIESMDRLMTSEWTDPDTSLTEILHTSQWENAESALERALDTGDDRTALRFLAAFGGNALAGRDWEPYFERAMGMDPEPSVDTARMYLAASMLGIVQEKMSWTACADQGLEMLRSLPEDEGGRYLPAALYFAGMVAFYLDRSRALPLLEEGVEAADRYGDVHHRTLSGYMVGYTKVMEGEVDEGLAQLREGVGRARRSKNMYLLSVVLFDTGMAHYLSGRVEEALPYYEETIPLWRRHRPEKVGLQFGLDHIGGILIELDRTDEARSYLEEALKVSRDYDLEGKGNYWGIVLKLARIDEQEGLIDEARSRLTVVAEATDAGPAARSQALAGLGAIELYHGEPDRAAVLFRDALSLASEIEPHMSLSGKTLPPPVLPPLIGFADLAIPSDPARAARLSGFADAWIDKNAMTITRRFEERRRERSERMANALGAQRLDAELAVGRSLEMEDAVSYALGDPGTPVSRSLIETDRIEGMLRRGEEIAEAAPVELIDALNPPELSVANAILTVGRAAALLEHQPAEAEQLVHEALDAIVSLDDPALVAACFKLLAAIAAGQQSYEESVRLMGAALVLGATSEIEPTTPWMATAAESLGAEAFATALSEGRQMSARAAADYASRGRGKRGRPSSGWLSLTPTESRVADLVAEGLTNPQIAERLFVSRRTVQTHLYNIFSKVGVQNRTELAAEMVKRRSRT
jgi:predicted ATPase/class 3 adenylate cyclase/DNA-binding CsgD family transcriptional regulator